MDDKTTAPTQQKPLNKVTACRECQGTKLSWDTHNKNDSGIQDGRLRSNEIKCLFVLGCDTCSETLAIVSADQVAVYLTSMMESAQPVS